jgi:hypothetical protein
MTQKLFTTGLPARLQSVSFTIEGHLQKNQGSLATNENPLF